MALRADRVMETLRSTELIRLVIRFGSRSELFESKYHDIHQRGSISHFDTDMTIHYDHVYAIIHQNRHYVLYWIDPETNQLVRDGSLQICQVSNPETGKDQIAVIGSTHSMSRFFYRSNILAGATP